MNLVNSSSRSICCSYSTSVSKTNDKEIIKKQLKTITTEVKLQHFKVQILTSQLKNENIRTCYMWKYSNSLNFSYTVYGYRSKIVIGAN